MQFAQKDFSYYVRIFTGPLYLLVGFGVLGMVLSAIDPLIGQKVLFQMVVWVSTILIYGYVGWSAVLKYQATRAQAGWAGALCGVIAGFAGGILGIITIFAVPEIIDASLREAMAKNPNAQFDPEMMRRIALFFALATMVFSPVFSAVMGWVLALLGGIFGEKKARKLSAGQPTPPPLAE